MMETNDFYKSLPWWGKGLMLLLAIVLIVVGMACSVLKAYVYWKVLAG